MKPEDLKIGLAGPIASVPTFFKRDGSQGERWLRSPQPSLDAAEVDELRAVFDRLGVLP